MSFGDELKKIRESKGMTVNQLAMYSGVSAASISRYETGERGIPKPPTLEKLASGLRVNYTELMKIAGYIEESDKSKDSVEKLIEYLELDLNDEEIMERMTFKVDNLTLSEDEVKEFIAFVRAKRFMKSGQQDTSKQ